MISPLLIPAYISVSGAEGCATFLAHLRSGVLPKVSQHHLAVENTDSVACIVKAGLQVDPQIRASHSTE